MQQYILYIESRNQQHFFKTASILFHNPTYRFVLFVFLKSEQFQFINLIMEEILSVGFFNPLSEPNPTMIGGTNPSLKVIGKLVIYQHTQK